MGDETVEHEMDLSYYHFDDGLENWVFFFLTLTGFLENWSIKIFQNEKGAQ